MAKLLIVDDDRAIRHLVTHAFRDGDIEVLAADSAEQCVARVAEHGPDVALIDIQLPDASGLDLFERVRAADAKLPIIFITADSTSETAIQAMKLGAYDYLLKPLAMSQVRQLVGKALELRQLMQTPVSLTTPEASDQGEGDHLVGRSAPMQEVYKAVGRVAGQDVTTLIRGESGTGKELVARAIYQYGARSGATFTAVNCAAIPDSLLESELFGHEKGSFTGADRTRIGKFEQADGGTLFLDEIGDMAPALQAKVLRLLQQKQFERVGGNQTITADVRVIAATHRNLEQMAEQGHFRQDLLYRLNGYTITIAPLRERPEDIESMVEHFLHRFCKEMRKTIQGISPEAMTMLKEYSWPGNVRELQSVLRQALLEASGPVIVPEFLPETVLQGRTPHRRGGAVEAGADDLPSDVGPLVRRQLREGGGDLYAQTLEEMERYLVTTVLRHTAGNQSQAAKVLGITRGSLRTKIRSLGIEIDQTVHAG